jgi:hypothetical protein
MSYNNPTTNFQWDLPIEEGSTDDWGRILNVIFGGTVDPGGEDHDGIDKVLYDVKTTADAAMPKAGGIFTGDVELSTGARLIETVKVISGTEFDWQDGNFFRKALAGGNNTLTFTGAPTSGHAQFVTLELVQPAGGNGTVTWPAGTKWSEGVAPTLSTDGLGRDVIIFYTTDGGSNYYAAHSMQELAAAT